MIIAGYAGIGKTTFCEKHQGEALDLICMPFKYSNFYEVSGSCGEDEGIKAHGDLKLREKWELYYYWAIKYLFQYCPEKYIIIPTVRSVMSLLDADDIPYTVVYPGVELKDEYEERYRRRGDSQNFLDVFIDGWEYMLQDLDKYGDKQIVLKRGQYLSDVISCDTETDETVAKELVSFEHGLLWENPRYRLLRQKKQQLLEEEERYCYSAELAFAGYHHVEHALRDFQEVLKGNNKMNEKFLCELTSPEAINHLINRVFDEMNLNYFEYSNAGDHLKFTNSISVNSVDLQKKVYRCMDSNNFLNFFYNDAFRSMSHGEAKNTSYETIRNVYLKESMSRILGVLRKGNEYWDEVVSDSISDEELKDMICGAFKCRITEVASFYEGKREADQIHGILYYQPGMDSDVIDDFVFVDSKTDLKLLLEQDLYSGSREPVFCLLSTEHEDEKIKYKEVVFRGDELRKMNCFI